MENQFEIIKHLQGLLAKETEAKEQVEEKLEDFKNSFLVIEKKYYPKGVEFYKKAKMFRLHREDVDDDVWKDWCEDLKVDDDVYTICVCAIGILEEYES
tara:strand:- start:677 stop:973 length:297 start_codon:yes stop_codon:yes gene_type:complete